MPISPTRHSMLNPLAIFRVVFIQTKNNKFLETKRIFVHKVLLTKHFYAWWKTITLETTLFYEFRSRQRPNPQP
jgi:hypothetical protein